ncbi:MAG: nucleoside recognition protein [Firmicutes bacterium]|nr:nucleoside recognition protein [Bacillota bacterium]
MEIVKKCCLNGLKSGWQVFLKMLKVVAPIYFAVAFLDFCGILPKIAVWLQPVMQIFGLPGEASIVLVLGNLVNVYSALGGMAALTLTVKQCTIIAGMILISHSLIMEAVIIRQSGVSAWGTLVLRFCACIVFGLLLNMML